MAKRPRKSKATSAAKARRAAKPPKAARTPKTRAPRAQRSAQASTTRAPRTRRSRLSPQDLELFRRLLLEKRAELVGDVNHMQQHALKKNRQDASGDLSRMPIHMADVGTDSYEQEFTLGLLQGEQRLLGDIDEALRRIEAGTYGICQATGKPITKARLKAQPWARHCIEYARMREKGLLPTAESQSAT